MLDLLFLTCAGFSSLFVLSYVQIKEKNAPAKYNVEVKAEFIITVSWPPEQDCDVDTYVQDPNGSLVFFKAKEDGLMHLERDDLGKLNDIVTQDGKSIQYDENREVVTLRGVIAGEYTVNVHMFSKRQVQDPTPVNVRLEKINPYKSIITRTVSLDNSSDEKTVFRFVLDRNGNVLETNNIDKKFTNREIAFPEQ